MKKSLLAFGFALASSASFAQLSTTALPTPGLQPTYIYDDMADTDPTTDGTQEYYDAATERGIFYFTGDADGDTVANPVRANGKLSIEVNNAGSYKNLFGISFGDGKSFDFSGNSDIQLVIKNDGATPGDTLLIQMQLQSANGKGEYTPSSVVETNANGTSWASPLRKKKIEFFVLSGETKNIYLDLTPAGAGEGTGGYAADPVDPFPCSSPATCPVTVYNLDPSQLEKILFFINPIVELPESDKTDYDPLGPYSGTIEISRLLVGTDLDVTSNKAKTADVANLSIYPNPSTDVATVSYNAKSSNVVVNVSDLKGNVVKSVNGTSTSANVATADLTAGLYVVSVLVDGVPSAPQKLVVK
ncbi:MAG: T9SS type A sorting domain-containing protein [Sporocytophaga sp.]|uniref:T9SS type A sorting domain-containing protein n=1 Tax=Sporocytophaga sp. TaxID=2231183 RepID=UPI001B14EDC3|nr:T9SS type A sorting domain-containing protein [Sporocytophaga sp.]MBO9699177.1 T9SS type A sorting domain-containing protein [Sporocytophaga sp.]